MFVCSKLGCGKKFAYSDNRNAHEKQHCGEGGSEVSDKVHICFCGAAYSRKSKLKVRPNRTRIFSASIIKIETSFFTFFVSGTSGKESRHHGATCLYRERTR